MCMGECIYECGSYVKSKFSMRKWQCKCLRVKLVQQVVAECKLGVSIEHTEGGSGKHFACQLGRTVIQGSRR